MKWFRTVEFFKPNIRVSIYLEIVQFSKFGYGDGYLKWYLWRWYMKEKLTLCYATVIVPLKSRNSLDTP